MACELYELEKEHEKIEDNPDNSTRFFIIKKKQPSEKDRTSLVVSVRNKPGALHDLLEPFQRHNVDMTLPGIQAFAVVSGPMCSLSILRAY